jgi:hypothetical protein
MPCHAPLYRTESGAPSQRFKVGKPRQGKGGAVAKVRSGEARTRGGWTAVHLAKGRLQKDQSGEARTARRGREELRAAARFKVDTGLSIVAPPGGAARVVHPGGCSVLSSAGGTCRGRRGKGKSAARVLHQLEMLAKLFDDALCLSFLLACKVCVSGLVKVCIMRGKRSPFQSM